MSGRRKDSRLVIAILSLLIASTAQSTSIVLGTDLTQCPGQGCAGSVFILPGQFTAQEFVLSDSTAISDIVFSISQWSVPVNPVNPTQIDYPTLGMTMALTRSIGPATTASDLLSSATLLFPNEQQSALMSIAVNQTLEAGSYFLVASTSQSMPNSSTVLGWNQASGYYPNIGPGLGATSASTIWEQIDGCANSRTNCGMPEASTFIPVSGPATAPAFQFHVCAQDDGTGCAEWAHPPDPVPVPEPATLGLFGIGLLCTVVRRRRRIDNEIHSMIGNAPTNRRLLSRIPAGVILSVSVARCFFRAAARFSVLAFLFVAVGGIPIRTWSTPIVSSTAEGFARARSDGTLVGSNSDTVEVLNYTDIAVPGRPQFSDMVDRAIFEFAVAELAGQSFSSVTLTLLGARAFPDCGNEACPEVPGLVEIELYGYEGDGAVSSADWTAGASFLGSFLNLNSEAIYSFDVTSFVNSVLSEPSADFVAFNLRQQEALYGHAAVFSRYTSGTHTSVVPAMLCFDEPECRPDLPVAAVPEPASSALLGLGFVGLALRRGRRSAQFRRSN